ncbi:TTN [Mytilus edulis]|uniref:TTN n=1 Tax=Mytilus edulis TaxID=6550 RepID=A0A8S3T7L9_MYTED|nr:TTN [Mytilus edulis]
MINFVLNEVCNIKVHVCAAFPLKCPEPAQWSLRARSHCPDPSKYFCLKNDLINGYSENCTVFDFLQPGRKNVLRGGLDADICSFERYQPWPIKFYTNVSTNCIFLKSKCNEEGQVVYVNGNRNIDRSCRCDYTRGYDFLNKPQNPCFCEPSKEDCSCYLKTCPKATDKLSPDYECHQEDKNLTVSECEAIIYQRVNTTRNKNIMEYISMREKSSNTAETTHIKKRVAGRTKELEFRNVAPCDAGQYCLKVEGKTSVNSHLTELLIHPMFTSKIEPQICIEGDKLHLACAVYAENIEVKWYKENEQLHKCENILIRIEKYQRMLTIEKTTVADSGNYYVKAGKVEMRIPVNVKDMFRRPLVDETIMEGLDTKFEFETEEENVHVQWFYNRKEITESTERIQISRLQGRVHTLTILQTRLTDSGTYSIKIRAYDKVVELNVKEMPETIKNMSVYDREAFLKAANTGTTTRYNVRVMIVGKQSAGKTCLLRRLMNEEIDDVISTDGINIERRKCHIDIMTGVWHFYKSGQKPEVLSFDKSEEFADCAFWDFAGQKEFYATHQTFLSANAVYLLVVDISEDFQSKTYENMIEKEFDSIGGHLTITGLRLQYAIQAVMKYKVMV